MLPTGRALSAPLAVVLVAFAGGFGLSRAPGFCRTLAPSPALMTSALSAVARRAPGRRSCLPSARLINNLAKNVPRETYNQVLTAAPPLVILLVEGGFSARERYFRGTWHCYPARNPPGHSRLLIVAKPLHPPGGLGGRVFKEPCPLGGDYRTSHQAGIVLSADRSPSESEGSVAMPRSSREDADTRG